MKTLRSRDRVRFDALPEATRQVLQPVVSRAGAQSNTIGLRDLVQLCRSLGMTREETRPFFSALAGAIIGLQGTSNVSTRSYAERIASCPIHRALDVDALLLEGEVPTQLWPVFHELLLIRGEYPLRGPVAGFGKRANELMVRHGVEASARAIMYLLGQFMQAWMTAVSRDN